MAVVFMENGEYKVGQAIGRALARQAQHYAKESMPANFLYTLDVYAQVWAACNGYKKVEETPEKEPDPCFRDFAPKIKSWEDLEDMVAIDEDDEDHSFKW